MRRKYAKYQGMKIVEHPPLREEVTKRLMDDQSPEAIAGYVRGKKCFPSISKNAIYRFITSVYGRRIESHRRRRRRRHRHTRNPALKDRVFIEQRPHHINERRRVGHAEADFIVSGKTGSGVLLVVADRKTRVVFLERILPVSIPDVHRGFLRIKERFPELRTVTTDNDLLLARHQALAELLNVRIYFCRPYHSWEKGTVENTNKVIRRDIPKGNDLSRYSRYRIMQLEAKLNRRPMRVLRFQTPQEALMTHRLRIQNKKHRHYGVS